MTNENLTIPFPHFTIKYCNVNYSIYWQVYFKESYTWNGGTLMC